MTALREQAVEMIYDMPEDKIVYVVNLLNGLKGLFYSNEYAVKEKDPFYSKKNQKRLARSIADAEAGRVTVHELIEVD